MESKRIRCPATAGPHRLPSVLLTLIAGLCCTAAALGLDIVVTDGQGNAVSGFRWLVEEDNTNQPIPGLRVADSLAVDIHASHAPVVAVGHSDTNTASIVLPDPTSRYVVSVLPDSGYSLGGANIPANATAPVQVIVNSEPIPTAQVSILAFHDNWPINNAPEVPTEAGLPGFTVVVSDAAGQVMMDAFGNPLGTSYAYENGAWVTTTMGDGVVTTNELGEALIKYLPPGKFGIQLIPPDGEGWIQTSTIEGTETVDAWVKADEPPVFVEFGPAAYHVFTGFVKEFDLLADLPQGPRTGSITGRLVYNHFAPPPNLQGFHSGASVSVGWVGLNEAFSRQGVYAAPCDDPDTGDFTISGIPPGTYQLVTWDENLDVIFGFNTVTIPDLTDPQNPNWDLDLGDVLCFAWFGTLEGSVFYDMNANGFRDDGEMGMSGQAVNLRFRDGTIYQATQTDRSGEYSFDEVFPFFKWLVVEIDFARFKDTGLTAIVDAGGAIPADQGWAMPSRGKLTPQEQPDVNPVTGNAFSRTEANGSPGEFLLQAMMLFLGQTNVLDWGKIAYGPDENGGISGLVFYAVTRAENDPRYAAGEEWEPGIPRVQINLYDDSLDQDGQVDDVDGDGLSELADRDNHPLGWSSGGPMGPEDVDVPNGGDPGVFDPGDAIQIAYTDSWDDNLPTGCIQDLPVIDGQPVQECFDNFGTWNQIRPGVFDGGFAITSWFPGGIGSGSAETDGIPPGMYIVEAVPPHGYEIVKEEDKNVDYGDEYVPSLRFLPPACVGDDHLVPDTLSLFQDIECYYAGENRPLCDRKQVFHSDGQNTAVEFFFFTEVPKAARAVGFINNDLAAEFDPTSPVYGEKQAPAWIPISFQDYAGHEICRVYCDEFGAYNALLPSSFTVNVPSPTGVSPHMISMVLNHPGPIPDPSDPTRMIPDPWFAPQYSQTPYTFNFESGRTTYLDTPVIPVAAFVGYPTEGVDVEPPSGTPLIDSVQGPGPYRGPLVCGGSNRIIIRSVGQMEVRAPGSGPSTGLEQRDYGFGRQRGSVTVDGVALSIVSWNTSRIIADVNTSVVSTGQLIVTRGDNGLSTPIGITLHVNDCSNVVIVRDGSTWPETKIQDAIDAAPDGALILVRPGVYHENPIVWKNVRLQGCGAGATIINASPVPFERVTLWHDKIDALVAAGDLTPIDVGFFEATEAPGILVYAAPESFDETRPGLIDGFTIMGGISGGGTYLAGYADYVAVSNNRIVNNQGSFGGGITVGLDDTDGFNDHVTIQHNLIAANGGINGGGGVTLFAGCDDYLVADNIILGNFSRNVGGGVAHLGRSDGGRIVRNQILFNEVFYGAQIGGEGGGVFIGSIPVPDPLAPGAPPLADGAGSVVLDANLIQGNLAGSGHGGGVRVAGLNGADLEGDESTWFTLGMYNNIVVNNVAALGGGGMALRDAVRVNIIHNTFACNDSAGTAALAFPPGNLTVSTPQAGGLVCSPHSPQVASLAGNAFPDPVLLNDIFWQNRSYYWDTGAGGLQPNGQPFWDLQALGGGVLNPSSCMLTGGADPQFAEIYHNTLLAAAVLDEGGNAITLRYPEIVVGRGDYHLTSGSPALDQAASVPSAPAELALDFDQEARPPAGGDIGADERPAAVRHGIPIQKVESTQIQEAHE